MFDPVNITTPTYAHYGPNENHPDYPNCNCHNKDRFLTISLRKDTYIRDIKLTPKTSLADTYSYVNIFFEYKAQVSKFICIYVQ